MTTAAPATLRSNTPARWQAALKRALDKSISVRQLSGCGAWVATSGSDAATAYLVTEAGCECVAARHGDPVCCHRAALAHKLGRLSLDTEHTPPAAPAAEMTRCVWCSGSGLDSAVFGTGPSAEHRTIACCVCRGRGEVHAEDVNPETEPCPDCDGTGLTEWAGASGTWRALPCGGCDSSGVVLVDDGWDDERAA